MNDSLIVDIHADDYGYTVNTSKDILQCVKDEALDSFSIICNTKCFEETTKMLYEAIPSFKYLPLMSVHLNFLEGFGHDGRIMSNYTWEEYLAKSYWFGRKKLKKFLKIEIKNQIEKTWGVITKCFEIADSNNIPRKQSKIRIDSHIHTHLIPVIWDALTETLDEEDYEIEYIRNPKEPLSPFLKCFKMYPSYSLINLIKNRILMFYSKKVDDYCDAKGLKKRYMCGLMFSGNMNIERLERIIDNLANITKINNRELEFLFHPGFSLKEEYSDELNNHDYFVFNNSKNRTVEKESVHRIKSLMKEQ